MKKIFNIVVFFVSTLISFGCSQADGDCNAPHPFKVYFYKDGVETNQPKNSVLEDFLKSLTFKATTEDNKDLIVKNSGSEGIFTDFHLPLYLNDKNTTHRSKKVNTEVFHLTILSGDKKLFNKKVKIIYSTESCFEVVKEVYYLDENNKWQIYKDEKVPLLNDKKEPTGYEYRFEF